MEQKTRERIEPPPSSVVSYVAPSVAEVKARLESAEALPGQTQRLILTINPNKQVVSTRVPITERVPTHAPDSWVFQIVSDPDNPVTIIARQAHLYDDLNTAANYIYRTTRNPVKYQISMLPLGTYDFDTQEDNSGGTRIFPPTGKKVSATVKGLTKRLDTPPEQVDMHDHIIPLEIIRPTRTSSSRVSAVLSELGSQSTTSEQRLARRKLITQAQKQARAALSQQAQQQIKRIKPKLNLAVRTSPEYQQLVQVVEPIALQLMDGLELSEDTLDELSDFIETKLSQDQYAAAFAQWSEDLLAKEGADANPIIRYLEGEADRAKQFAIESQNLMDVPEYAEPEAFSLVPVQEEEPLNWAECDCCKKFRVYRGGKVGETDTFTCSQAGPGAVMDIRGMPARVQEKARSLAHTRYLLRNRRLDLQERRRLEEREKQLCNAMCAIPEESTEAAEERTAEFASRVVENRMFRQEMEKHDAEVKERAKLLANLKGLDISAGEGTTTKEEKEEEKEETLPVTDASLQQLVTGRGTAEDRRLFRKYGGTRHLGTDTSISELIDFYLDLIAAATQDIQELTQNLLEYKQLEEDLKLAQETKDETDIAALGVELEERREQHDKDVANLQRLMSERADNEMRIAELKLKAQEESKDELQPMDEEEAPRPKTPKPKPKKQPQDVLLPQKVEQGEQNEIFVLNAAQALENKGYFLHRNSDVTPVAVELRVAARGTNFGLKPSDSVFAVLDPDKYNFLATNRSPLGSTFIKFGKGYFVPRYRIRTQADVDAALQEVPEKFPGITEDKKTEIRDTLQRTLQENRALPYVLGGAFLLLAQQESKDPQVTVAQRQELLTSKFATLAQDPAALQNLLQQYEIHLQKIINKKDQTDPTRTGAVGQLLQRAKQLEAGRSSTAQVGMKHKWWEQFNFPVILPIGAPSTIPRSLPTLPPLAATLPRAVAAPSTSKLRRREKATSELEPVEKKARVAAPPSASLSLSGVPAPDCNPADIAVMRAEAQSLGLFLATQQAGLQRLCERLFDPVTRTQKAIRFLRLWRQVVDQLKQTLQQENIFPPDTDLQKLVLKNHFDTPEKRAALLGYAREIFIPRSSSSSSSSL